MEWMVERTVKQYVGLDVSLKEISVFVVDEIGVARTRGSSPCDLEAVAAFLAEKDLAPVRLVHESGQFSI